MGDHYSFEQNANTDRAWKYFAQIIGNNFGTSALMAGLYLRSGMDPYTGCEKYGYPNKPELKDFAYDRVGFGIGKWKNWIRKQSFHNLCRVWEASIYDINAQMQFVMDEFSGTTYGPVLRELMDATSVKEAAYQVYDHYIDIKKRTLEKRDICAELAMDIYSIYGGETELRVPVKYVVANRGSVRVCGQKGKVVPFLRKTLGYLDQDQLYRFISVSDDGKEYGYVKSDRTHIVTRMEVVR